MRDGRLLWRDLSVCFSSGKDINGVFEVWLVLFQFFCFCSLWDPVISNYHQEEADAKQIGKNSELDIADHSKKMKVNIIFEVSQSASWLALFQVSVFSNKSPNIWDFRKLVTRSISLSLRLLTVSSSDIHMINFVCTNVDICALLRVIVSVNLQFYLFDHTITQSVVLKFISLFKRLISIKQ